MFYFNIIKNFFTKDNIMWTLLLVSILFIFLTFKGCEERKELERVHTQNMEASKKQIKYQLDNNGKLIQSVALYEMGLKQLEKTNKELYDIVKSQKEDIHYAQITIGQIQGLLGRFEPPRGPKGDGSHTYTISQLTKGVDGSLPFEYPDTISQDYKQIINGIVKYEARLDETKTKLLLFNRGLEITKNDINLKLTGGIKRNKEGIIEGFIQNSRFKVTDMSGVILSDEKPSIIKNIQEGRFKLGVSAGIGITNDGFNTIRPVVGPSVTVGLTYIIF